MQVKGLQSPGQPKENMKNSNISTTGTTYMQEKRRHTQHLPGVAYLDMHSLMNSAYVNLSFSVYHRGVGVGKED